MLCKPSAEPTAVTFGEGPTLNTVLVFLKATAFGSISSPLHLVSTSTAVYGQGDREETRS